MNGHGFGGFGVYTDEAGHWITYEGRHMYGTYRVHWTDGTHTDLHDCPDMQTAAERAARLLAKHEGRA